MAFPPVTGIWPAIWMESDTATSNVPTESNHSYSEVEYFRMAEPNTKYVQYEHPHFGSSGRSTRF